jgi:hypothetical protein
MSEMRPARAVTAAKTGDWGHGEVSGNPAFVLMVRRGCACNRDEAKRGMHEKVIDMPVGRPDALPLHPDVTGDPGQTPRSLCRTGIHMPTVSEREGTKRTDLHDAAAVLQHQAVDPFMHIRYSAVCTRQLHELFHPGAQESRVPGKVPQFPVCQDGVSTERVPRDPLPGNRTVRNLRR